MKAKKNDNVKVHYRGTFTNGEVFDTSAGREPLAFTVGAGQMIPGFDQAVEGMELNETKVVNIPAAEAYGERNEELMQEIPKTQLPADMNPQVGQKLVASSPQGQQEVLVAAVSDDTITIDVNHPMAGKELVFEIELVEIA
ncbi:MAG: peptidylprolyl isomerase [Bacteroidota bacterium]